MSGELDENDFYQEGENIFDLKSIFPKLLRIWPWILVSFFISFGLAYYFTQTTVPTYKVSSKFFIKENERGLSFFENASVLQEQGMGLTNEMLILKSRPIAEATLNKLDFRIEYYEQGTFILKEIYKKTPVLVEVDWKSPQLLNGKFHISWSDSENYTLEFIDENYTQIFPDGRSYQIEGKLDKTKFKFGEWVETPQFKIRIINTSITNEGSSIFILRGLNYLVDIYAQSLNVELLEKGSSILDLGLLVKNQEKGEVYLNTLMETYLELELQGKNEIASRTINFIDSQVAGVADSLTSFENQLQNFRSSNQIFDLSSESSSVFDQLTDIEQQIAEANLKRRYYRGLKDYLVRENYNEIVVPSGLGIDDPYLNGLIENLLEVQVDRSRLLTTQTEFSPQVKAANQRLADLNTSIREILSNVENNNLMIINDLENRKEAIESSFRSLPQAEQNLIKYQRQATLTENIYNFLSEKRAEAAISKASNSPNNRIIEYARGSGGQVTPKPFNNYVTGALIGLFFPVILVFIIELFRSKIEDIGFLEKKLKLPVINTIPKNKTNTNLVVFNHGKSGISESFRSLRANIRFMVPSSEHITLLITSTISGEGKTFCALNLASAYSLSGKKTILLGCDLRRPKIFQDFQIPNNVGLSTFLSGQNTDWKSVIVSTEYENLDLIVSGPVPPNPSELIINPRFETLLKELKKNYDIIILDTPPIGLVSETIDLLNFADITLFVFRQNYSQRSFIDALNNLKHGKGLKNIYAIFNNVDSEKVNYGYGYTYGYGYGYYENEKSSES